ncbi:MAG: ABC transporter ATP-binding protein [Verrucomicrobiota bacterium]
MNPLLKVDDLTIDFDREDGSTFRAVDHVSFDIFDGQTLAVVGESGSGKSVSALALARLLPQPPARYVSGKISLEGIQILTASPTELRRIRGKKIAYVFQEPSSSLNPVMRIGDQIAEMIQLHRPEVRDVQKEVISFLGAVGISNPEQRARAYPHEFSGGMQQRAMIAMALSCHPKLLIADEPTTALDVTIQAQILDLLREMREKFGMSILLITHNFGIVKGFADAVSVMYHGKIVEAGSTETILAQPQHPYTKALLECVPRLGQKQHRLTTIDLTHLEKANR